MSRKETFKNQTNRSNDKIFVITKLLSRRRIFEYQSRFNITHCPIFLRVSISRKAAISRQRLRMRNHVPAETAKNLPPIPKRIFLNPDQQNHRHPSTTNTALLNFLKTYHYVSLHIHWIQSFHQTVFVESIRKNNKRKLDEKLSFVT